jgi:hypothetical protein
LRQIGSHRNLIKGYGGKFEMLIYRLRLLIEFR